MPLSNSRPVAGAIAVVVLALQGLCVRADGQSEDPAPAVGVPASGNILAHVPLASLTATRERPLFSPTRRGPPPAPALPDRAPPPPPVRIEEGPRLMLLGIIRSPDGGGSAVVLDDTDHTSSSLRVGDSRRGWVVQSIDSASVVVRKQERSETLRFPVPQGPGPVGQAIDD